MTGIEASTSPPALPRWFGPRASPDDPAVAALIARVARGVGWADVGGEFNLNVRIDAEPPVVIRVHRPWATRRRVGGLRRLRERLQRTQVRVARPIRTSGCDLVRVADRWAELEEFIEHVHPPAGEDSYVRLFEELGRLHTALKAVWEPGPPEPLDDHRTLRQLRYSIGFTRRKLGPGGESVVRRMRQLTGELSELRKGLDLPCAPIHGDYKLGNAGELSDGAWATFDLDFARVRERLYDVAGSLNHVAQSGPDGVGPPTALLVTGLVDGTAQTAVTHNGGLSVTFVRAPGWNTGFVSGHGLPPLPAGKAYQAWFTKDGKTMEPATVFTDSAGVWIDAPGPIGQYVAVGFTIEKSSGARQPTSPPFAVVPLTPSSGSTAS